MRQLCPVDGCNQYIIKISDHLRRKHNTTATKLGIVRKQRATVLPPESITLPRHITVGDSVEVGENFLTNTVDQGEQCHTQVLPGILDDFKRYMESEDAGRKKHSNAYRLSCKQILGVLGGSLSALAKDAVKRLYVTPLMNANPPKISKQTLCTKLIHLEHFCKYIRDSSDLFDKEVVANAVILIRVLPSWRQSYRDECLKEAISRGSRDRLERITTQHITGFNSSLYSKSAHALLLKYDKCIPTDVETCHTISSRDFVRGRNYLMATLCINNAHRTGVFAHFSMSDFKHGLAEYELEPDSHEGDIVFTVTEHKTASTHGAATFSVNTEERPLLAGYIKMRNKFVASVLNDEAAPLVFITTTGGKLTQSHIASCLTAAFSNSGYNKRVTCTKLRKAATTLIYSTNPEKTNALASHMCHRPATQEKHYHLIDKRLNTVTTTRLLRNAYRSASNKVKIVSTVKNIECSSLAPVLKSRLASADQLGLEPEAGLIIEMQPSTSFSDGAVPHVSCTAPESSSCTSRSEFHEPDSHDSSDRPYTKKIIWSTENRELIRAKFAHMVRRKLTPIEEIRQILRNDPHFVQKLEKEMNMTGKILETAVRGKIRQFFRNH